VFGGTAVVSQAPQTLVSQGAIALAATGLLVQAAQTVAAEAMSIPVPEVVRGAHGALAHATASAMGLRRTGLGYTPLLR